MKYDVITVGAGPSGAYASYLLAREGLKVLLLDKDQPGGKVCTGIISEKTFQTFSLDGKCIIRNINSFELVAPSGKGFVYEHPTTFAHVVDRKQFDLMLQEMARLEGADFLGQAVTHVEIERDGVKVRYGENGQYVVNAEAMILAMGVNRRLLRMVGLRPPDCIRGVQVEVDYQSEVDRVRVFLGNKIAPGSFAWVVPLPNGRARIGMSNNGIIMPYFNRFLRSLGIKEAMERPRSRPIPYSMIGRSYAPRTLIVGDAAGQAKTTTGGGIYYGLLGATIAAQTLKEAFSKGDLSEGFLRSYEELWKEKLSPEIETGLQMRKLFSTFSDKKINALTNLACNDGIAQLIRLQAKFDWQRRFLVSLLKRLDIKGPLGIAQGWMNLMA